VAEIHDFVRPMDHVRERLTPTHGCTEIGSLPRRARDLPLLIRPLLLTPWRSRLLRAASDQRPEGMRWFLFRPHASGRE
jgi:hypothetical protein